MILQGTWCLARAVLPEARPPDNRGRATGGEGRLARGGESSYNRHTVLQTYKNILIIKPSALGDLIQVLPVLHRLRQGCPQARISWFVRSEFAPLIQGHPDLDDVILFDRRYLGKAWWSPGAFAALVRLIDRLRRGRFDLVLDFQGLFRTSAFGWLSGCPVRIGMAGTRELSRGFYTHRIAQKPRSIHLVDYYLDMLAAAGIEAADIRFDLPDDADAESMVRQLLAEHGVQAYRYAVLVPGSAHADKCWPVERFAELADRITERFGLSVIATGTAGEAPTAMELALRARVPVANLAGRTSIRQLVALMRTAAAVVSNDTGPGHIAAALHRPLVLIFGRSNPARVLPYGRPQCAAAIDPTGRGFKADNFDPAYDIRHITVEDVLGRLSTQVCSSGRQAGATEAGPAVAR